MMVYKLVSPLPISSPIVSAYNIETMGCFSFDPANTDYQQFKADVLAGAELQDADGNVMTAEQANEFISTLP